MIQAVNTKQDLKSNKKGKRKILKYLFIIEKKIPALIH